MHRRYRPAGAVYERVLMIDSQHLQLPLTATANDQEISMKYFSNAPCSYKEIQPDNQAASVDYSLLQCQWLSW